MRCCCFFWCVLDGVFSADSPERGLIPRICTQLLHKAEEVNSQSGEHGGRIKLEVSYLEIWCESVRDLLVLPGGASKGGKGASPFS